MTQISALPVSSAPPVDWWRRVSTAINLILGEVIDVYRRPTEAVTADYAFADTDYAVFVDASGGPVNVTLPSPALGREAVVKKVDASANAVTVIGKVDGAASATLSTQWAAYALIGAGDDAGWYVL